jgi:hypothetical protein
MFIMMCFTSSRLGSGIVESQSPISIRARAANARATSPVFREITRGNSGMSAEERLGLFRRVQQAIVFEGQKRSSQF